VPLSNTKQTRTLVRVEGIITQLVFQHALRIRMKEETPATVEKKPTPSEGEHRRWHPSARTHDDRAQEWSDK
jgi:hypothetical protein